MALDNLNHLCLEDDVKNILKILLNDDDILKMLSIPPSDSTHDVLTEPSIVGAKKLSERFNEYYLSDDPLFVNWSVFPNEDWEQHGRICFFPGKIGLKGTTDNCQYYFHCFVPFEWHKKTNVGIKVLRRLVQLFKGTYEFGNIGKVDFNDAVPLRGIDEFVGFQVVAYNWNFVV